MKARSWKKAETRMARDVGTERKPCDGSRDGADFADGICCYQLKVRKMLPTWLWAWLSGVVATAKRDGKVAALVLRTPRMRDSEALVIVRWSDWVSLHGDALSRCQSAQAVEFSAIPDKPDQHDIAQCELMRDHLGSHQGRALGARWWWNEFGHGTLREK